MNPVRQPAAAENVSPAASHAQVAPVPANDQTQRSSEQTIRLPDAIASRQALRAVIFEIRHYSNWQSQQAVKERYEHNQAIEPMNISEPAKQLIENWHGEGELSQESLSELSEKLEKLEAAAPGVSITLAAPAPNNIKTLLVKWCRQNIDKYALVEMSFNSTMLGGMVVRYGSHVHDWSLRREILNSINRFPEVLRRV